MASAVFAVASVIVLAGALGVVLARNPVHAALFLVQTLLGMAIFFVTLDAHFLAAVQVIVYAGAIVILFLFVLMLLGVDRSEDLGIEPIAGQRPLAVVAWAGVLGTLLAVVLATADRITGARSVVAPIGDDYADVRRLGRHLFTTHVFAFEITALLLTVAVIGAVVLSRRLKGDPGGAAEGAEAETEASA